MHEFTQRKTSRDKSISKGRGSTDQPTKRDAATLEAFNDSIISSQKNGGNKIEERVILSMETENRNNARSQL